jgi:hypothetical protein
MEECDGNGRALGEPRSSGMKTFDLRIADVQIGKDAKVTVTGRILNNDQPVVWHIVGIPGRIVRTQDGRV